MMENPFRNIDTTPKVEKKLNFSPVRNVVLVKKNRKPLIIIGAVLLLLVIVAGVLFLLKDNLWGNNTKGVQQSSLVEQYKEQLPVLAEKVAQDAGNLQARRDYAVALYATGDIEKAKEQYLEEVKLNTKDAVIYNNLGNIARDQGKYDEAIVNYKKAIELNKDLTSAYINMANVYVYSLSKPDQGVETYKSALAINPNNLELNLLLANTYEQMGKKDEAKKFFDFVLTKDANNQAALQGLARLVK